MVQCLPTCLSISLGNSVWDTEAYFETDIAQFIGAAYKEI